MPSCHYPPDSSGPGTNRKPDPEGLDMYEGGKVNIVIRDSGAKSRERRRVHFHAATLYLYSEESNEELEDGKPIRLFKRCDRRSE